MKTEHSIHLNHTEPVTLDARGFEIRHEEHGYVERGVVVVKAETEDEHLGTSSRPAICGRPSTARSAGPTPGRPAGPTPGAGSGSTTAGRPAAR
jgi:hypothetical protein